MNQGLLISGARIYDPAGDVHQPVAADVLVEGATIRAVGARAKELAAGAMEIDAAIDETRRRTRAYAKRQVTWLRAERNVHWVDAGNPLGIETVYGLARHLQALSERLGQTTSCRHCPAQVHLLCADRSNQCAQQIGLKDGA